MKMKNVGNNENIMVANREETINKEEVKSPPQSSSSSSSSEVSKKDKSQKHQEATVMQSLSQGVNTDSELAIHDEMQACQQKTVVEPPQSFEEEVEIHDESQKYQEVTEVKPPPQGVNTDSELAIHDEIHQHQQVTVVEPPQSSEAEEVVSKHDEGGQENQGNIQSEAQGSDTDNVVLEVGEQQIKPFKKPFPLFLVVLEVGEQHQIIVQQNDQELIFYVTYEEDVEVEEEGQPNCGDGEYGGTPVEQILLFDPTKPLQHHRVD
eukprot:TCONS_00057109-protein